MLKTKTQENVDETIILGLAQLKSWPLPVMNMSVMRTISQSLPHVTAKTGSLNQGSNLNPLHTSATS